jgi:hypothetical protein
MILRNTKDDIGVDHRSHSRECPRPQMLQHDKRLAFLWYRFLLSSCFGIGRVPRWGESGIIRSELGEEFGLWLQTLSQKVVQF